MQNVYVHHGVVHGVVMTGTMRTVDLISFCLKVNKSLLL